MAKEIQVLVYRPGQPASVEKHATTLEAQQELVGGYIEEIGGFGDGIIMIANEEGKPNNLPENFTFPVGHPNGPDIVRGTVFFCRTSDSSCASLDEADIVRLKALVRTERIFIGAKVW